VIGAVAIACSAFPLSFVIDALIVTRILVQFIGQIGAVALLRRRRPDLARPYRIWLYPLPSLVALLGWCFLFLTSDPKVIGLGLLTLLLGVAIFYLWSWRTRRWPFAAAEA
jgi:amino acid transporter